MASLYGLLVMSLTYDASSNTYSADLDTGEIDFSSGFEATKVKRVGISKEEFNRIKKEVEQQEINQLAQQRLEQFHKMFEETRMAEQREQLGRDISRALFQRHGVSKT